ncbi:nickel/cobalt transporter [Nonomuraea polychroma]|uniref:nickel/cobalt transporter n=1 Tax=Nonomuraea polychroma TaxID=46176 RepID=UPI003D8F1327
MTFRTHLTRWAAASILATIGSGLIPMPAAAHPTDEVLQQAYLTPTGSRLAVQLDLTPGALVAPAFAQAVDTDGDQKISARETAAHVDLVTSALNLRVDGRTVPLTVTGQTYLPYELLAAAGGAVTIKLTADLPGDARTVVFTDGYRPGGSTTVQMNVLVAASDPAKLDTITHADEGRTITLAKAGAASPTPATTPPATGTTTTVETSNAATMLGALRAPLTSPWALLVLIFICALLGALHALTPGHGKALLASYLVGTQSTPKQAVTLGAVITVTHTAAVIALGAVALAAGRFIVPGVLVPTLEVATGIVVLILGARLLVRRRRHRDGHPHGEHHHGHGLHHPEHHHSGNGPAPAEHDAPGTGSGGGTLLAPVVRHRHTPPAMPSTLRGIAAMGVSGGIIPCPEALSVLLLAIGLNRTALGLTMIVAFSAGLASVLVGLGLILVSARATLDRFRRPGHSPLIAWLPVFSAAVVTVLGLVMTINGVTGLTG